MKKTHKSPKFQKSPKWFKTVLSKDVGVPKTSKNIGNRSKLKESKSNKFEKIRYTKPIGLGTPFSNYSRREHFYDSKGG